MLLQQAAAQHARIRQAGVDRVDHAAHREADFMQCGQIHFGFDAERIELAPYQLISTEAAASDDCEPAPAQILQALQRAGLGHDHRRAERALRRALAADVQGEDAACPERGL